MSEEMTKEELLLELRRVQTELYHLKMAQERGLSPSTPRPDGYSLPSYRSGQIPSSYPPTDWNIRFGRPFIGAILDMSEVEKKGLDLSKINACDMEYSPERIKAIDSVKEKIAAAAETIVTYQEEAREADLKAYSGWSLRITDFEGLKFLYLSAPDERSMTLEVDTRPEVNGVQNRPQVLTQFANVLGTRDIAGVWPRWWKIEDNDDHFVLSRNGMSYVITPKPDFNDFQGTLIRDFFKHLNTIRVKSIDEADGA